MSILDTQMLLIVYDMIFIRITFILSRNEIIFEVFLESLALFQACFLQAVYDIFDFNRIC